MYPQQHMQHHYYRHQGPRDPAVQQPAGARDRRGYRDHADRGHPNRTVAVPQPAPAAARPAPRYDAGLGALFRMAPAFTPSEWGEVEV